MIPELITALMNAGYQTADKAPEAMVRAAMGASGGTAVQDFMGLVNFARHLPSNVRIDPDTGAVLGDSDDPSVGPAAAMGRFVLTNPAMKDDKGTLKHELEHVRQSSGLGPAYLPLAAKEFLGGEEGYATGPLERGGLEADSPTHELLRQKQLGGLGAREIQAYLRGILGGHSR